MTFAKPTYSLSVESAKAILDAARPAAPPSPETIEKVRRWLEDGLKRAIRRVRGKPLTQRDVSKLDRAHARLQYVIRELQDRTYPPPRIPTRGFQTEWEYWLTTHQTLKFKRGPRAKVDWHFIGELIALYEVTSKRSASASQPRGPTSRFLKVALNELQDYVPEDARSYFQAPKAGVLGQNLDVLRRLLQILARRASQRD